MVRLTTVPAACAAIPAVVAVGFCGALCGAALFGSTPAFWRGGPLTLAEAAALRDRGEVARLIEAGVDPNGDYELRPNILAVTRATPLEAAVAARRPEIVHLLMREGASMDEPRWRSLHCLATTVGDPELVDAVDTYQPSTAAVPACPP